MNQNRLRLRHPAAWIAAAVGLLLFGGLAWIVIWSLGKDASVTRPSFDDYREPWESAMAKASVQATFPSGPVDIAECSAVGARPFEATFTPEEIAALLAVYRHTPQGDDISLRSVRVAIPQPGWLSLSGRVVLDGTAYSARVRAPVEWDGTLRVDERSASVIVEGFSVNGDRKTAAVRAVEEYVVGFIDAAPGLVIDKAVVTGDGIEASGTAPVRLNHPEALE